MAADDQNPWISVIGRSLALIALHKQELGNATVVEKAVFLIGLGVPRAEAAALLGTSDNSIAVMLSRKKRQKGGRRGK
jgi:hypothetical protein